MPIQISLISVPYRYDEREQGLGAGPSALLKAGLAERLSGQGFAIAGPATASLDPSQREEGRTAVNIGHLGASTAALVATARRAGGGALILAGDDTAAIGVVSGVQLADGAGTAIGVVWLDAHGDFNTPETSYSGILAGMPVAILTGLAGPLWREAAGLAAPVPTDRVLIAGTRDLDEKEAELIRSTDARVVPAAALVDAADPTFRLAVARLAERCSHLCLHVDLDLLDPRLVPSASTPSASGLTIAQAAGAMGTVLATGKVATVCLTSLNPGAGTRGERSVKSALELLTTALAAWELGPLPAPPA